MSFGDWRDALQTASWNGVPFGVIDSAIKRGRRTALHEYPFRDDVQIEDLGRGVRRIAFKGFLVGDDFADQEKAMLAAVETAGPGELVHPTLGSISANLVEFSAGQRREQGRVIELDFAFIQGVEKTFPTSAVSTQDGVLAAASDADTASASDFFSRVGSTIGSAVTTVKTVLQEGAAVVHQVVSTVQGYVNLANGVVNDVRRTVNAVNGLTSIVGIHLSLGRYANGNLLSLPSGVTSAISGITSKVAQVGAATTALISGAITAGTAVRNAGLAVVNFASSL